jgi:hypothetical protein
MSDDSNVPSSVELLQHHERQHAKRCPAGRPVEHPCPCGAITVVQCSACGWPLTIWLRELDQSCEHLAEVQRWVESIGGAVR